MLRSFSDLMQDIDNFPLELRLDKFLDDDSLQESVKAVTDQGWEERSHMSHAFRDKSEPNKIHRHVLYVFVRKGGGG